MKNKSIAITLILILLFAMTSCYKQIDTDKPVEFTDFTVERCVRKQLKKDWNEEITTKELEEITLLCISSMYDPTFGNPDAIIERQGYLGYLDLSDIKYLKNLEILKLDTYGHYDNVANLETITECKKLEKLYMIGNSHITSYSINPQGYKYWENIIIELPELNFFDLGMYFDEHMEEVVLSEIDNKALEIYYGDIAEDYYYKIPGSSSFKQIELTKQNANGYQQAWDYEYRSIKEKIEYSGLKMDILPAIYVDSMEMLTRELEQISDTAEDIIIVYESLDEIDFSVFDRFSNLVTLSVFATEFGLNSYYNDSTGFYESKGYIGATAVNLDVLSEIENLQVINLSGFVGDISGISEIKNLRELSIVSSVVDSVEFIGELVNVKELTLGISSRENREEMCCKLDESVSKLKNLKYYMDLSSTQAKNSSLYENINAMESLETLIVYNSKFLHNIVKSKTIKNLCISGIDGCEKVSFEEMDKLESLVIHRLGDDCEAKIDYNSIIELPNIKSVVYPCHIVVNEDYRKIFNSDLAQKIADNENISAFTMSVDRDHEFAAKKNTDIEFIRELYEAGVEDGICQPFIEKGWGEGKDYTFDDYYEYWKKIKENY